MATSAPLPDVSACLASGVRFEVFDPWNVVDSDDLVSEHDLSKVTQVHAEYNLLGAGDQCVPGIGDSLPSLEVLSFQRDSAVAAMLREAFMSRVAEIAADPTDPDFDRSGVVAVPLGTRIVTAYVVPLEDGDGMTAFVDMSPDVTVQISGPITKEEIDVIVSQLQSF